MVVVAFAWTLIIPLFTDRYSVVVVSDSMSPGIQKGDVVVIEPSDGKDLGPPSVILFATGTGDELHRINDVKPDGSYETKGDANAAPDTTLVEPSQVKGVGKMLVPRIGIPLMFIRDHEWGLFAVFLVVATLVVCASAWGWSDRYDPWLINAASERRTRTGSSVTTHGNQVA
jgi:signal peptidase